MKHFLLCSKIGLFLVAMGGIDSAKASSYAVTAEMTRIDCSNGNHVYIEPLQILQLTAEIDRVTYRVRLPSKFARRCPEGRVSSFSVYNIGRLNLHPEVDEAPSLAKKRSERETDWREREEEDYMPYSPGYVLSSSQSANDFFKRITKKLPERCQQAFLGRSGFGPWGDYVKDELSNGFFEETLDRDKRGLSRVCPAYKTMTLEQKKNLIILTMMAQFSWESGCVPNKPNYSCPKGTCYGVSQLHLGKEDTYIHMKQLKRYCPKNAARSPEKSISCTLGMFMQDLWQGEGIVGNSKSYWEVERPGNVYADRYEAMMDQIPDCQKRNLATRTRPSPRSSRISKYNENTEPLRRPRVRQPRVEEASSNLVPIGTI